MSPQQQPPLTLRERFLMAERFMQLPALTLMVFLRRDLGYRTVNPLKLIAATGILAVVANLAMPNNPDAKPGDLLIFAALAFVLGIGQHLHRWYQFNRNIRQHSYYIGTSPFAFRWLPNFLHRNRRIARIVDPLFCMGVGYLLLPYSPALAMYLLFAGVCLRAFEYSVHRHDRNRQLDLMDSVLASERQAGIMERHEHGAWAQPRAEQGIPTGNGDDIQELIRRRR